MPSGPATRGAVRARDLRRERPLDHHSREFIGVEIGEPCLRASEHGGESSTSSFMFFRSWNHGAYSWRSAGYAPDSTSSR